METISVTLPNGSVIKNVPKDITQEQLKDSAIRLGAASLEDFGETTTQQDIVQESDGVASFLQENMDLPVGLSGALGGAYAMAPTGPVGMFVGGVVGGALGTASGSLISDELTGEDLDYANAVEQGLISAGIDVITLGLGKVLKPAFVAGKKALGFTPEETAKELLKSVPEVGTKESLQASQRILEGRGATLTPFQAGIEGSAVLKEKIANSGIFSSVKMEKNAELVNQATSEALTEVLNRFSVNVSGNSEDIAEVLYNVVSEGKQALGQNYARGLDDIVKTAGKTLIPVGPYTQTLDSFVQKKQGEIVNELSDDTIQYIEGLKKVFGDSPVKQVGLNELIIIDKKLSSDISSKFGNPKSDLYNETLEYELNQLSSLLRETTNKTLTARNPEAAAKYAKLKADYSAGIKGILPEVNRPFITQASKGNYKSLGNLLTQAGNINQVVTFKKSLKEAFSQAEKAGTDTLDRFISFDEADALIKKGFLQKTFPDLGTGEFSIKKYRNLANKLADPTEASKFKAVLGADYPKVKQLINLMSEASVKPQSNLGELFLRNKEYQVLGIAGALVSGVAVPAVGPLIGASAILIPNVLAKAATNPKHVNKLLAYDKAKFATEQKRDVALSLILSDIIDTMTEEEAAEVRNIVRNGNQKRIEQ